MTDKISICLKCGTDCECPKWYETEIRKLATESEQLRKRLAELENALAQANKKIKWYERTEATND